MKVFETIDSIDVKDDCAISVGTFDGIHVGHMEVIRAMQEDAQKRDLKTLVYTFKNHPASFFKKDKAMPMIMNEAEKYSVFNRLGIDYVCNVPFDKYQHEVSSDEFVNTVLVNTCRAKSVSVGYDFKFGYGASAGTEDLIQYGQKFGFTVSITPPVLVEGERVSSTNIRRLLLDGELEKASKLLGRPHFIIGEIRQGKQLGRKIGFPTINIDRGKIEALRKGVYFTNCVIEGEIFTSITNIGLNPTVSDTALVKAETHLLEKSDVLDQMEREVSENIWRDNRGEVAGYTRPKESVIRQESVDLGADSLYGKQAEIIFLKWHRDEVKFSSKEELAKTVLSDIEEARAFFR